MWRMEYSSLCSQIGKHGDRVWPVIGPKESADDWAGVGLNQVIQRYHFTNDILWAQSQLQCECNDCGQYGICSVMSTCPNDFSSVSCKLLPKSVL
jgi:hypothetical protein